MDNSQFTFDTILSGFHEENLRLFPLKATYAGDNRYNDLLPNDISEQYQSELRAFYEKYLTLLKNVRREDLNTREQISYDVLKWECEIEIERLHFPTHLMPINQFLGLHITMGQLATGRGAQPFVTVEDYENWLSRLSSFVVWCDTAVANMKRGVSEGYVLPKSLIRKVIPQLADLAAGPVEDHLFYAPITLMPGGFSESDSMRLTEAYRNMIEQKIIPAFSRLHSFCSTEYLRAGRDYDGIAGLPHGQDYYALQIKTYTTTDMTAEEIFETGRREVERISNQMEEVINSVGFQGDLRAFFDHVRNRKESKPFSKPGQVIRQFYDIRDRMEVHLERLFDLKPKTRFEVRRTEAFRESSASAEYVSGSLDGSRPGIFYVPIPNIDEYNNFADESLFLHEAIPGHHYQISLQQEDTTLPAFRQTLWYSAFGEGWALYCESLGKELGLYDDPYQYFGMLNQEMHRSIRLVVDVGIHAKGWTREEAIQYSLDHEAESEESIIAEIERYMAWPGQALSYKIGQLSIAQLRSKAEQRLGEDFDIKAFHNLVLEDGCVPLKVLEEKMDRWLSQQR